MYFVVSSLLFEFESRSIKNNAARVRFNQRECKVLKLYEVRKTT